MLLNMRERFSTVAALTILTQTILLAPVASAAALRREEAKIGLWVNNWCPHPIFVWEHQDGVCDQRGTGKLCSNSSGTPFIIDPGDKSIAGSLLRFDWETDTEWEKAPRGLKILSSKADSGNSSIVIKYGLSKATGGQLRWSITPGTAFADQNVKVTPAGTDAGIGDCKAVRCRMNDFEKACSDGLRDVVKPHMCQAYAQNMWIDLCESEGNFVSGLPSTVASPGSPSHSSSRI